MENNVNYIDKIIKHENLNFFGFLREKGIICDSVGFHEYHDDYIKSEFGRDDPIFLNLYSELNKELEKTSEKPNPYVSFSRSIRNTLKKDHPELKGRDITKKIADLWKNMDKKEKEKYRL